MSDSSLMFYGSYWLENGEVVVPKRSVCVIGGRRHGRTAFLVSGAIAQFARALLHKPADKEDK